MKRILVYLISFILILTGFPFMKSVQALKNFHVEVQPRRAGVKATYKFFVEIEKKLPIYEYIKFGFPQGTLLDPPLPTDEKERSKRLQEIQDLILFLSCCPGKDLPILEFYPDGSAKSLQFLSNIELDPSKDGFSDIAITIPDLCGFVLPKTPGWHTYKFSTKAEPSEISTQTEVVISKIGEPVGKPEVLVEPSMPGLAAKYTIDFNVGRGGALTERIGTIRIKFPALTEFSKSPQEIRYEWILVNNQPLLDTPNILRNQIVFITPLAIKDSEHVNIQFDNRCGITNPNMSGKYKIEVSTIPGDPEWVSSLDYDINSVLFKLSNYKTNRNATYQLIYIQEKDSLVMHDTIRIKFPKEVQINGPLQNSINHISINNQPLCELHEIEDHIFVLCVGNVEVKEGDPVEIRFNCPEIRNPFSPCSIHLEYKPDYSKEYIPSPSVAIIPGSLEIFSVKISPPNALEKADYSIKVAFGDYSLPQSKISVYFTHLKTLFDVSVQNIEMPLYEIILKDIDNGSVPGDYILHVYTDQEPQGVWTNYTILPPLPKTTLAVKGNKGKLGWYLDVPMIQLSSSDPSAEIVYWWDHQENQVKKYSAPFIGDPYKSGQYKTKLYYQSKSVNGSEHLQIEEIWVDTVMPEITIDAPKEQKLLVNQDVMSIEGHQTLIKTNLYGEEKLIYEARVSINGEKVKTDPETGLFRFDLKLVEGENIINIQAEDEAGNIRKDNRFITVDTTKPEIIIQPHEALEPYITGKTDPTALLSINGELVKVEGDGAFRYKLSKVGFYEFTIVATDPVGNVNTLKETAWYGYTIILQIGSKKALNNGNELQLNIAPLIQKSKTLVPFRFIGEQLNATISYTTDPKTKLVKTVSYVLGNTTIVLTIGAENVQINGKSIPLDVPAQIIKGTTMVPLRFIAENLNCQVEWESIQKTITITYPNSL